MGHDSDADINESMSFFEAALTAPKVELARPTVRKILVAVDQSNQDDTVCALATVLTKRWNASVHLVHAYPGPTDEAKDRYLKERLAGLEGDGVKATSSRGEGETSADQIMAVRRAEGAELILLGSPYLDDLRVLGQDSIGSTLDLLMARAKVPLLIVREPKENVARCLDDILLPITIHTEENVKAASWGLACVADKGTIRVLAIADAEALKTAQHLLGKYLDAHALEPEVIEELEAKENAGLNAALQKAAAEAGLACKVKVRSGDVAAIVGEVGNDHDCLVVSGCPQNPESAAYQRVQGFIRGSSNPILVV